MERIFGTIPAVLTDLGVNDSATEAVVLATWRQAAGEMLSKRTVAAEYFEKRLIIAVEDKTWQRNLEELAPQMLFKLNRTLGTGTVKFIEFRIDPAALKAARPDLTRSKPVITDREEISPSLIAAANRIENETLRESFLNAAAAYLSRQRS